MLDTVIYNPITSLFHGANLHLVYASPQRKQFKFLMQNIGSEDRNLLPRGFPDRNRMEYRCMFLGGSWTGGVEHPKNEIFDYEQKAAAYFPDVQTE